MNKALILFLILAGLAALVAAKDIPVNVGGANGENVFEPEIVMAAPGDTVCIVILFLILSLVLIINLFRSSKLFLINQTDHFHLGFWKTQYPPRS